MSQPERSKFATLDPAVKSGYADAERLGSVVEGY